MRKYIRWRTDLFSQVYVVQAHAVSTKYLNLRWALNRAALSMCYNILVPASSRTDSDSDGKYATDSNLHN